MQSLVSQVQIAIEERDKEIEKAVGKPNTLSKSKTQNKLGFDESFKDRRGSVSMKSVPDSITEKSGARGRWTGAIKTVMENTEDLQNLVKKVRELVPYNIMYQNMKRMPTFNKKF